MPSLLSSPLLFPLSAKVESRIISLRSLPFYGNAAPPNVGFIIFVLFSPLNHKVAVEHITHKWGREEEDGMVSDGEQAFNMDGSIG